MSKAGVTHPSEPVSEGSEVGAIEMKNLMGPRLKAVPDIDALDTAPPSELRELGGVDSLTGVADRKAFDAALERELARASRHGEELTLVMLNLDHFGSLNETYGQEVGDAILRRVGDALLRAARESDTPARYTGDEFAVLLPACPRHESFKAAARMRELVSAVESVRPITISAGIATYPAHAHTPEGLVRAAGEALYEAKLAGRDRVMRSTRGSLYRSNERRQTLGKDQVARLHDRRKSAPAPTKIVKREPVAAAVTEPRSSRMLVTAQPPPAAQPVTKPKPEPQPEVVETVNAEASPTTMLVTAQPPPASVAKTTLNYSEVEARLRQIATARIAG